MRNPRTTTKCSAYLQQLEKAPVLCVQLLSHVPLYNPMDFSPSVSSVRGIFQARKLEWVAISYSRGYLRPRDRNCICVSCIGRQILYH